MNVICQQYSKPFCFDEICYFDVENKLKKLIVSNNNFVELDFVDMDENVIAFVLGDTSMASAFKKIDRLMIIGCVIAMIAKMLRNERFHFFLNNSFIYMM